MKIDKYLGVCRVCFEPVKEGSEITVREGGWPFHSKCVEANPNSYYLALERIRGKFEQGANATEFMNDMEGIFKIPALNDEAFNEDNDEVIKLYQEIGDSRFETKDCNECDDCAAKESCENSPYYWDGESEPY